MSQLGKEGRKEKEAEGDRGERGKSADRISTEECRNPEVRGKRKWLKKVGGGKRKEGEKKSRFHSHKVAIGEKGGRDALRGAQPPLSILRRRRKGVTPSSPLWWCRPCRH